MKANELRHGNIVKHIESISDYHVFVGSYDQYAFLKDWFMDDVYLEELQPIPLTEKWLLDFGFEAHLSEQTRTRGKLITYTKHYGLSLLIRDGYFNAVVSGAIIKSVFTVHQLQNLYFALTGQELTLKEKK